MGVLSEEELIVDKIGFLDYKAYTFPVSRYLVGEVNKHPFYDKNQSLEVCDGNILSRQFIYRHGITSQPSMLLHHMVDQGNIHRIVTGDDEVLKWFKEHSEEEFYHRAVEALGKVVLTAE